MTFLLGPSSCEKVNLVVARIYDALDVGNAISIADISLEVAMYTVSIS